MFRSGFKFLMRDIDMQIPAATGRFKSSFVTIALVALMLSMPTKATAVLTGNEPEFTPSDRQFRLAELGASEAVRLVERQTGGRVLSVNQEERGGAQVYRVKVLLPEGRVRTIFIDKQSGAQREG